MGGNSPADLLSDDDEDTTGNHHHQVITQDDSQTSPHSDQTINPSHSLSPSHINLSNCIDDAPLTTTSNANKSDRENGFRCSPPLSPSSHGAQIVLPNKSTLLSNLPIFSSSSSSNSAKRLNGTLNRLLNSITNRSSGHHYNHQNGLSSSSSPSASSSTMTATNVVDSTGKEPKTTLELNTQSIESEQTLHYLAILS